MPQITNTTSKDIWFPQLGIMVPANGYLNSDVFPVQNSNPSVSTSTGWIPAGLTINYATNAFDPILLYQAISTTTTVTLPATILPRTTYEVKIYCTSGQVAVQFNYSGNTSFVIPSGDTFVINCQARVIDNIIFTISAGYCFLTVRKA